MSDYQTFNPDQTATTSGYNPTSHESYVPEGTNIYDVPPSSSHPFTDAQSYTPDVGEQFAGNLTDSWNHLVGAESDDFESFFQCDYGVGSQTSAWSTFPNAGGTRPPSVPQLTEDTRLPRLGPSGTEATDILLGEYVRHRDGLFYPSKLSGGSHPLKKPAGYVPPSRLPSHRCPVSIVRKEHYAGTPFGHQFTSTHGLYDLPIDSEEYHSACDKTGFLRGTGLSVCLNTGCPGATGFGTLNPIVFTQPLIERIRELPADLVSMIESNTQIVPDTSPSNSLTTSAAQGRRARFRRAYRFKSWDLVLQQAVHLAKQTYAESESEDFNHSLRQVLENRDRAENVC